MNESPYENTDILEMVDRYEYLITEYSKLALDIVPLMEKFGKLKKELELMSVEFVRRGYTPEDPEGLKKLVEEALEKAKEEQDGEAETNRSERSTQS